MATSFTFVWGSEGCSLHLVADDPTYTNSLPLPDKVSFHGFNTESGSQPNYSVREGNEVSLLEFAANNILDIGDEVGLLDMFKEKREIAEKGLSALALLGFCEEWTV